MFISPTAPPYAMAHTAAGPVACREAFRWDAFEAYLFDIDGTLLRERSRLHARAFSLAAERVTGHSLSLAGVHIHGSTDPVILRDAIDRSPEGRRFWQPHAAAILEAICAIFAEGQAELQIDVMPGTPEILSYLRSRGKLLGVATGNLEAIGWSKIRHAGLAEWFAFGGFSDGLDSRPAMVAAAAEAARALAGPQATLCVLGDTPFDIHAARENGLPSIAVATGHSSFDALLAEEPDCCTASFLALLEATRTVA